MYRLRKGTHHLYEAKPTRLCWTTRKISKRSTRELQRYYISDEQRAGYNVAKVEVTTKIHTIENEKTELKKAIAVRKAILTRAKNAADKYRKIRGKIGAPARLHIKEAILFPRSIESTSYHGGKLNGVSIGRLMNPD
jgi:hypothetical protein